MRLLAAHHMSLCCRWNLKPAKEKAPMPDIRILRQTFSAVWSRSDTYDNTAVGSNAKWSEVCIAKQRSETFGNHYGMTVPKCVTQISRSPSYTVNYWFHIDSLLISDDQLTERISWESLINVMKILIFKILYLAFTKFVRANTVLGQCRNSIRPIYSQTWPTYLSHYSK
jgi:hypothetical protein